MSHDEGENDEGAFASGWRFLVDENLDPAIAAELR
jgi:hypothetical protein